MVVVSPKGGVEGTRTVPVSIPLWLPRPHTSIRPWSRRPPESSRELQLGLENGMVSQDSMPGQPVPLMGHRRLVFSDVVIGSTGEIALARVRVRSSDVARAKATLFS